MLCGDGHLSVRTKKKGDQNFSVEFCNTNLKIVELFDKLFYSLFGIRGNFHSRKRNNRKEIFEFRSYSKDISDYVSSLGFPIGVKRDILRIPSIILNGTIKEKLFFIKGVLITDGYIRENKTILFHSGSKLLLEDLSKLFYELFGIKKSIKSFIQKNKFISYQLNLNINEAQNLLKPPWHNGTAPALSFKEDIFEILKK